MESDPFEVFEFHDPHLDRFMLFRGVAGHPHVGDAAIAQLADQDVEFLSVCGFGRVFPVEFIQRVLPFLRQRWFPCRTSRGWTIRLQWRVGVFWYHKVVFVGGVFVSADAIAIAFGRNL